MVIFDVCESVAFEFKVSLMGFQPAGSQVEQRGLVMSVVAVSILKWEKEHGN